MGVAPFLATAAGIALFRGVLTPLLDRYRAWRDGPREQVARRNWRGVYVPDLTVKRGERLIKFGMIAVFLLGLVGLWTVMAPPGK